MVTMDSAIKLGQSADRVLGYAKAEATIRDYEYTGSEHVLLAMATTIGSAAYNELSKQGIDYRKLSESMPQPTSRFSANVPLSSHVTTIIHAAHTRAGKRGSVNISTLDILAEMQEIDCKGKKILEHHCFKPNALESAFQRLKEE